MSANPGVLKRVAKWLALVCLALVALVGLILGGLHTPQGRGYVLSKVTALLASRQIDFRADQLRYNLLDLSLDLRDVTIRSPRGGADPPFAVIGRLQADLSLRALLRGRYVVQSGSVERARVHYLVDSSGDVLIAGATFALAARAVLIRASDAIAAQTRSTSAEQLAVSGVVTNVPGAWSGVACDR